MTLKTDPTKSAAGTKDASTEGDGGQELDLQSSKQLADAGIDVTDWKAKYDGLVGSTRQLVKKHQTEVGRLEGRIQELEAELEQVPELKTKADKATELEQSLAAEQAKTATLDLQGKKQQVLLQYPMLTAPTKEGKPNPLLDVLMASNLDLEQFTTKAAELANLDWAQAAGQQLRSGGTPPPPPPPPGADTVDAWREKALAAHEKFIASGRKDKAAQADEQAAWDMVNKLSK